MGIFYSRPDLAAGRLHAVFGVVRRMCCPHGLVLRVLGVLPGLLFEVLDSSFVIMDFRKQAFRFLQQFADVPLDAGHVAVQRPDFLLQLVSGLVLIVDFRLLFAGVGQ